VCRRITAHEADAADACQEALMAIVRGLGKFDGRSSFSTWAYRVATNASLDELRRRRRRPAATADLPHDDDGTAQLADPDAGQRITAVTDRLELEHALRELAEDFRVPVVLRDVADLDYADIAEILDVPIGTVKSRIARGRVALSHALQRNGNHSTPDERPRERDE
jgi:RNA polymerase sigma-70 factor, ECF subfamily